MLQRSMLRTRRQSRVIRRELWRIWLGSLEPAMLHSLKWETISASARCSTSALRLNIPTMDGVEHRQLTAQRPMAGSVEHFPLQAPRFMSEVIPSLAKESL